MIKSWTTKTDFTPSMVNNCCTTSGVSGTLLSLSKVWALGLMVPSRVSLMQLGLGVVSMESSRMVVADIQGKWLAE